MGADSYAEMCSLSWNSATRAAASSHAVGRGRGPILGSIQFTLGMLPARAAEVSGWATFVSVMEAADFGGYRYDPSKFWRLHSPRLLRVLSPGRGASRILCCWFVTEHERRRILPYNATPQPNCDWIVQQRGRLCPSCLAMAACCSDSPESSPRIQTQVQSQT